MAGLFALGLQPLAAGNAHKAQSGRVWNGGFCFFGKSSFGCSRSSRASHLYILPKVL